MNKNFILFVDDDPLFLSCARYFLKDESILYASSSKQARKIMEKNTICMLITDIDMPHENGIALACDLKQKKPDLPIIMMSASKNHKTSFPHDVVHTFMEKPFDFQMLKSTIATIISKESKLLY